MIGLWHDKLGRLDPHVVTRAFDRWIDSRTVWPLPKTLLPLVEAERAAALPAPRTASPASERSQAVNAAFGLLSSAHLRELDRVDPKLRCRIVEETADWFLPYWREATKAKGQEEIRPYIASVNEFVERRLGKSWRQILEEELAARGAAPQPVRGFKQVPERATIPLPERVSEAA